MATEIFQVEARTSATRVGKTPRKDGEGKRIAPRLVVTRERGSRGPAAFTAAHPLLVVRCVLNDVDRLSR